MLFDDHLLSAGSLSDRWHFSEKKRLTPQGDGWEYYEEDRKEVAIVSQTWWSGSNVGDLQKWEEEEQISLLILLQ